MNMLEKLEQLMIERDLTKADVSRGSGLPYTTVDGLFKKGVENARLTTLKKLSSFFNVSMEYLMNDEITERNVVSLTSFPLSDAEIQLINTWRTLPLDEKTHLLSELRRSAHSRSNSKKLPLP